MAVQPNLAPMTVYYREGNEPGIAKGVFLANRYPDQYPETGGKAFADTSFPVKSSAGGRIYKYLKLFDPGRVRLSQKKAGAHLGAFRLGGMPPHTAEVAVDATGKRPKRGLHPGPASYLGADFPYISDAAARIAQVRGVGRLAKRFSDKIRLSITNHKPVKASTSVLAGTVVAGEYRLEAT